MLPDSILLSDSNLEILVVDTHNDNALLDDQNLANNLCESPECDNCLVMADQLFVFSIHVITGHQLYGNMYSYWMLEQIISSGLKLFITSTLYYWTAILLVRVITILPCHQKLFVGHPYHTDGLTCLSITSDSTIAITGSKDGSVHLVNITIGRVN